MILQAPGRAGWRRQPQGAVQLTAKAARDMVSCVVPPSFIEPQTGYQFAGTNGAVRSTGILGNAYETTATSTDKWEASGLARLGVSTTDFTIEVLLSITATSSLACIASFNGNVTPITTDTTGRRRALLAFGGSSPFNIYFWGESADLDSGVLWRNDGSLQHVFVTASGGTMRFFRDSKQIASGSTPSLAAAGVNQFITFGSRHPSGVNAPAMKVFKATVRNRALSLDEIVQLTNNPWLDFKPRLRKIYVGAVAVDELMAQVLL